MIHDQVDAASFIRGAVRHVTAFLRASKDIYRFVDHVGSRF